MYAKITKDLKTELERLIGKRPSKLSVEDLNKKAVYYRSRAKEFVLNHGDISPRQESLAFKYADLEKDVWLWDSQAKMYWAGVRSAADALQNLGRKP